MDSFIYIVGLVVALSFVFFSIDDLIWNIIYVFKGGGRKKNTHKVKLELLDCVPPRLLGIIVAAWHEEGVLEQVIDHMIATVQYPRSMYHIFLGVYPNDAETIAVAEKLENKYANVHVIINAKPGPTCKADNINNVIKNIREFELQHNWKFCSITIHDSEDVVHPYEYKITNYLLNKYDVLQFPVFPLQKMPSLKSFFREITTGTYADEFAENHFRTMGMRDRMSAVVPSAGTGFVISSKILDLYKDKPLFPEDSLTEDYKLSLILAKQGFPVHYVLEKVPRLLANEKVKWDYVATRSIFPATFRTAVRQKTRWIYGITMDSAKFADIFKKNGLGASGKYTIYKDWKAKISNLLVLPGYLVFIYFIVSLFVTLPVMYAFYTFSWWLCMVLTFMMLFNQTLRAVAIGNIYGTKSVFFSCFFPPLMPMRLIWGNIINFFATIGAWKKLLFLPNEKKEGKKVAWNKTDHEFLDKHVLYRYYRNIGDELLEKEILTPEKLGTALKIANENDIRVGEVLLRNGDISEEQLIVAVANVQHQIFVKSVDKFRGCTEFDKSLLEEAMAFPLIKTKNYCVVAQTNFTPVNLYKQFNVTPDKIRTVFTTSENVMKAINNSALPQVSNEYDLVVDLIEKNKITWEQAVIALDNQGFIDDILDYMGLLPKVVKKV